MNLLVLLLIFPTVDSQSNSFVKSFGQKVDTNELEWEARVGKINSKTSKVTKLGSKYKWVRVRVKSGED
jgi:hypothetical protein